MRKVYNGGSGGGGAGAAAQQAADAEDSDLPLVVVKRELAKDSDSSVARFRRVKALGLKLKRFSDVCVLDECQHQTVDTDLKHITYSNIVGGDIRKGWESL